MDRISKINEQVKREIGLILQQEMQDPRLQFVTITGVEVSKDLQHAKVYFSALGDHEQAEKAQDSLNNARGLIRRMLAQRLQLRYTPEITFFFDKSIEYGARIDQALEEMHNEFEDNH